MKILIIDNHPIIVSSLMKVISQQYPDWDISSAVNSTEADTLIQSNTFELIICDYFLDIQNGLDIFLKHKQESRFGSFLLVTVLQHVPIIELAIKQGINGIVSKEAHNHEYLEGIHAILQGSTFLCTKTKELLAAYKTSKEKNSFITKREFEILKLLKLDLKNHEIANQLHLSVSTIETHKKNLIKKFNVKGTTGLLRYVHENHLLD
jgi:DNA-binding NarL/FixJ family response regulator